MNIIYLPLYSMSIEGFSKQELEAIRPLGEASRKPEINQLLMNWATPKDLVGLFDTPGALKKLRNAGLVEAEKKGNVFHYKRTKKVELFSKKILDFITWWDSKKPTDFSDN